MPARLANVYTSKLLNSQTPFRLPLDRGTEGVFRSRRKFITKSANLQEICACEGELWFVSVEAYRAPSNSFVKLSGFMSQSKSTGVGRSFDSPLQKGERMAL